MFCCERELRATPWTRFGSELLLVGLQLAYKHVPHLVTQGGIVHVVMIAIEEVATISWKSMRPVTLPKHVYPKSLTLIPKPHPCLLK